MLGILFALLPYTFYRYISHIVRHSPFVPILPILHGLDAPPVRPSCDQKRFTHRREVERCAEWPVDELEPVRHANSFGLRTLAPLQEKVLGRRDHHVDHRLARHAVAVEGVEVVSRPAGIRLALEDLPVAGPDEFFVTPHC